MIRALHGVGVSKVVATIIVDTPGCQKLSVRSSVAYPDTVVRMKHIFRRLGAIIVLTLLAGMPAIAVPVTIEGTNEEVFRKTPLPLPQQVKIAVLPFSDYQDDIKRRCVSSVYSYLLLEQKGFVMLPILDCFEAVTNDKEVRAEEMLSRSDAARIGHKLGATWAVYGEVKSMGDYEKPGWFKTKKKADVILRVSVVNCESGDLVYWRIQAAPQEALKRLGKARADKRTRTAIEMVVSDALRPLLTATSKNETTGSAKGKGANDASTKLVPTDEDVLAFVNKMWPDIYRQAFRDNWSLV